MSVVIACRAGRRVLAPTCGNVEWAGPWLARWAARTTKARAGARAPGRALGQTPQVSPCQGRWCVRCCRRPSGSTSASRARARTGTYGTMTASHTYGSWRREHAARVHQQEIRPGLHRLVAPAHRGPRATISQDAAICARVLTQGARVRSPGQYHPRHAADCPSASPRSWRYRPRLRPHPSRGISASSASTRLRSSWSRPPREEIWASAPPVSRPRR